MSRHDTGTRSTVTRSTVTWAIVGTILAGCLVTAGGIMAVAVPVIVVGAVVVVRGAVAAIVFPHLGWSDPIAFSSAVPGTPGAADSRTAGGGPDSPVEPAPAGRPDLSAYQTVAEADPARLPDGPDAERAKPQHVNLPPDERIRHVGGRDVIEVPERREV